MLKVYYILVKGGGITMPKAQTMSLHDLLLKKPYLSKEPPI